MTEPQPEQGPGRRYGLVTPEIRAEMRAMRASGASYREIGRRFHVNAKTAWKACNEVPRDPKPAKPLKPARIVPVSLPRVVAVRMRRLSAPFTADFAEDIARLETRAAMLESGDESARARGQLVRELIASFQNVVERSSILRGRQRAARHEPRENDIVLRIGYAA